nr:immunoglobulin heavy chain junction region [Macaca mulatta]MOV45515.1 immunoglobulin heavy chain junction region [Macaca mulatta]
CARNVLSATEEEYGLDSW